MHSLFEQVWVISLRRRADRLQRFLEAIDRCDWPFKRPEVFSAIDGDKVGVPRYWQTGGGSYGCLRSHWTLLERALQDDVSSLLVLEDDAEPVVEFARKAAAFLEHTPPNWDCLMFGGQHVNSQPIPIAPGVLRAGGGGGIQRTHCYGIRGVSAMKELCKIWANAAVHCDWVMGPAMAKFNTYAPDPFLVGQASGRSDISGAQNPQKLWRPPSGFEPVILLRAPRTVVESLQMEGRHGGYSRDKATGIDKGLLDLFETGGTEDKISARLAKWIEMIQWEVASLDAAVACTIWHPEVTEEMIRSVAKGPVITIEANSVAEAHARLPEYVRPGKHYRIPVVILRTSRRVMEALRYYGFHSGHSRNPNTGEDNGLKDALELFDDPLERAGRVMTIAKLLNDEAAPNSGIATLWHPEVRAEMLPPDRFDVVEIAAGSAEEAREKRRVWEGTRAI